MTSKVWRLGAAAGLSVIVFFASVGTAIAAGLVTPVAPLPGAAGVSTSASVKAGITAAYSSINTLTFQLRDSAGNLVPAVIFAPGDESGNSILRPIAALAPGTTYTATVKGGRDGIRTDSGNTMADNFQWSFTAAGPDGDSNPVELGVRFRSDYSGYIKGIRFYKHATNTGTHVGSLWTNTGALMASATFFNESAAGWQQVIFSPPVAINANSTYVASYHTNAGHYATNSSYFAVGFDAPPLHANSNGVGGGNGLYRYGSATAFPTDTYNATNYWVDVVFSTTPGADTTAPAVNTVTPAAGSTGVNVGTVVSLVFTEMIMASKHWFVHVRAAWAGRRAGAGLHPCGWRNSDCDADAIVTPPALHAVHRDGEGGGEGPGGEPDASEFQLELCDGALAGAMYRMSLTGGVRRPGVGNNNSVSGSALALAEGIYN